LAASPLNRMAEKTTWERGSERRPGGFREECAEGKYDSTEVSVINRNEDSVQSFPIWKPAGGFKVGAVVEVGWNRVRNPLAPRARGFLFMIALKKGQSEEYRVLYVVCALRAHNIPPFSPLKRVFSVESSML